MNSITRQKSFNGFQNQNNEKSIDLKSPYSKNRTKLYVSNLPLNCSTQDLIDFFGEFGNVLECTIMSDKYAFIHYGTMREAQCVLKQANQLFLMGKKLFIQLSTSRFSRTENKSESIKENIFLKKSKSNLEYV